MCLPGTRPHGGIFDRTPLHARDAGGNADHELGAEDANPPAGLIDEVLEHALGDDVVSDHAVPHRADRSDRARRAAQHEARLFADGDDVRTLAVIFRERHHRGLGEDDAFSANVHDDVGRAEVDADLTCEHWGEL